MKFLLFVVLAGAMLASVCVFGAPRDTDWESECRVEARRAALKASESARDGQREAARARREALRAARGIREEASRERLELQREQTRARREIIDEVQRELHRAWVD
ncbi:MAG TPA: hypothetical protein VMH80_27590 [Bryobacteraceae bacterium]|nr:hypothetical protein [Bryobacteraceae bacterium]